jgi:pyruvate/2-oxoglutarate dehydrogenase complex dihydrolipoamide acyltransferase (E2) component
VSSSSTDGGATGTLVDVTMPQMGVSVAEGTVVEWKKRPGDWVEADETICEVSTDKIDTDVPAPVAGRVAELLVEVDQTVEVGTVLARIATDARPGEAHADEHIGPEAAAAAARGAPDTAAAEARGDERTTPDAASAEARAVGTSEAEAAQAPPSPTAAPKPTGNGDGRRRYSPVVQRIAAEHGIDLEQVRGTGRGGRVRKQDVLAFVEQGGAGPGEPPLHIESPYRPEPGPSAEPAPAPVAEPEPALAGAPPGGAEGDTLSRMRRSIGAHMKRSLETTATCTTWIEGDMSRIEAARKELGLTALPFVARCTIAALREHPQLNAWLEGERHTVHRDVNLGIAVSLGEDGLIVPVVERAHELSVEGLAVRIKDLARRARARELSPDEVRGGTFTITNPGQFGSIMATPIINLPQVAILDLEAVVKRPVVVTGEDGSDAIAIRPMTILGLSWDHRALDGALAARFLASVKRHIEGWTGA